MANVEERLMTQDSGLILDEHFIASTVTSGDPAIEESMNFVWKTMKKIQNLDLLPEELSVTTGVAIMHSDASVSEEFGIILEASQEFLLEALWYLLEKNHDFPGIMLGRIVSIITDIRTHSKEQSELEKTFVTSQKEYIDVPEVLDEFFELKQFSITKSDSSSDK